MDCSDWSNGIQYQTFDTRPDTEFKSNGIPLRGRRPIYDKTTEAMICAIKIVLSTNHKSVHIRINGKKPFIKLK